MMYNSQVLGFLKVEDMPMVYLQTAWISWEAS